MGGRSVSAFHERGLHSGASRCAEPYGWVIDSNNEGKAVTGTLSTTLAWMSTTTPSPFPRARTSAPTNVTDSTAAKRFRTASRFVRRLMSHANVYLGTVEAARACRQYCLPIRIRQRKEQATLTPAQSIQPT